MTHPADVLADGDALLIVDVQKDFCPGGALAIERGDEVVPVLNEWLEAAQTKGTPTYASRDWHPVGHVSFKERGGQWPPHCIQDSRGADYHPDLRLDEQVVKVTKGVRFDQDQNSVFDQTGLEADLRWRGVKRLWVGGLALDVCVLASVLDARKEGFDVVLIQRATKPVSRESGRTALRKMGEAGVETARGR